MRQLKNPIVFQGKTVILAGVATILAGIVFGVLYAQTFGSAPEAAVPDAPLPPPFPPVQQLLPPPQP